MKVLILADHSSSHTLRWVKALTGEGIEIYLFSLSGSDSGAYKDFNNFRLQQSNFSTQKMREDGAGWSKVKYLRKIRSLKSFAKEVNPDIVHAHYATSYGLLGVLLGMKPFVISVWGSDVYDFPNRSILHRVILKYILGKANRVFSTSKQMAEETRGYTNNDIEVIPFGIDLNAFRPGERKMNDDETLTLGTIKSMESVYGIDILIEAFAILVEEGYNCNLLLVGGGTKIEEYQNLVKSLDLDKLVRFTGSISHNEVIDKYGELDIYAALSRRESFGVAILEASACGLPVVVSNVGGLPEVVKDGITGIVLAENSPAAAAQALKRLIQDSNLRRTYGKNGRQWVKENYNWDNNVSKMIDSYRNIKR